MRKIEEEKVLEAKVDPVDLQNITVLSVRSNTVDKIAELVVVFREHAKSQDAKDIIAALLHMLSELITKANENIDANLKELAEKYNLSCEEDDTIEVDPINLTIKVKKEEKQN